MITFDIAAVAGAALHGYTKLLSRSVCECELLRCPSEGEKEVGAILVKT